MNGIFNKDKYLSNVSRYLEDFEHKVRKFYKEVELFDIDSFRESGENGENVTSEDRIACFVMNKKIKFLLGIVDSLPINADICPFCNINIEEGFLDCEKCSYGKLFGICDDDDDSENMDGGNGKNSSNYGKVLRSKRKFYKTLKDYYWNFEMENDIAFFIDKKDKKENDGENGENKAAGCIPVLWIKR